MRMRREEIDISAELRALRPAPRPEFTAELDSRAVAGFRQPEPQARSPIGRAAVLFRNLSRIPARARAVPRRRLLAPVGAAAVAAIIVATALVVTSEGGPDAVAPTALSTSPPTGKRGTARLAGPGQTAGGRVQQGKQYGSGSGSSRTQFSEPVPTTGAGDASAVTEELAPTTGVGPYATHAPHRDVERSAAIVLVTDPSDVRGAAAKVFEAVHAYHGIVLRSSVRDGRAGQAGATFDLLVPSGRLGDAMAAFSDIAGVRSRRESTLDVTAQTIGLGERLRDARGRVESLLGEVSGAETEAEREAAEAKLHSAQRQASALRARLASLQRRTHLSSVSLRIETGSATSESNGWGLGDALEDAGNILTVAAGVGLVGLAILVPPILIGLLAWLAHRGWVRRRRERALD